MGPLLRLRVLAAPAVLLGAAACTPSYPGEPEGAFEVVGTLEDHGCGMAAVPVQDPLRFRVELRARGAEGFWRLADRPALSGSRMDGTYRFRFDTRVRAIEPDPSIGTPGCTLEQTETVEVTLTGGAVDGGAEVGGAVDSSVGDSDAVADAGPRLDAGPSGTERTLEGTNRIELAPAPGSACGPLLPSQGGPFRALPCTIEYGLRGTPTAAF